MSALSVNIGNKNQVFKVIRDLHFNPNYCYIHLKLCLMYICFNMLYFITLYNCCKLQGDVFLIGIIFGLSEYSGCLFSEKIITKIGDLNCMRMSVIVCLICVFLARISTN